MCHEVIGRDSVLLYMLELKGHGKVCMKEEDENDHLKGHSTQSSFDVKHRKGPDAVPFPWEENYHI
jgi:hypothetical protein